MDLRQLEYVVAVVDEGGFTRAARAVHVSQPALSQSIRALERELGIDLFHRHGRTVRPTAAGEAIVGPARRALRDARVAREAVDEVRGLAAGRLDLTCLATLAVHPVAGLVGAFRRRHPGVRVAIAEPVDAAAALDAVRDGAAEVAVTDLGGDLAGLAAVEVETQELVALVPPELVAGRADGPLALGDLVGLPLVAPPPGTSVRRLLDETFAELGATPDVVVEMSHREALPALVASGAGATVVPRGSEPLVISPAGEVEIRELDPPVRRRVGAVHRDASLSPAARAFLDVVRDGAPPRPSGRGGA